RPGLAPVSVGLAEVLALAGGLRAAPGAQQRGQGTADAGDAHGANDRRDARLDHALAGEGFSRPVAGLDDGAAGLSPAGRALLRHGQRLARHLPEARGPATGL